MARAGRIVVAKDEGGNEYIYQSVNSAVASLNIAPTTIRRYCTINTLLSLLLSLISITSFTFPPFFAVSIWH